jgi:hypothetical protein
MSTSVFRRSGIGSEASLGRRSEGGRGGWWRWVLGVWWAWSGGAVGGAGLAAEVLDCAPPPPGLIAWWPGDGDARDLGTNGLGGELLPGTAFAVGKVGAAFAGGGAGTGVRVPNSPWLRPTNLSVAAWIQSEGPDGYAYVAAKSYSGTRASYALYTTAGRQLAFYVETAGPTGWARSGLASLGLWDGRFHFVVGTYDNTRVRLYVDGEEIGTGEAASGPPRYRADFQAGDLFLGTYEPNTAGEHPFRGQLDEVALWDRALSRDEIRTLYAASEAGMCRSGSSTNSSDDCLPSPSGLVNWWPGDGHGRDLVGGVDGIPSFGADYAQGMVGEAFRFDGSRARVDFERDAPAGAFTIEAWVYYSGEAWGRLGNGWSTILEFGTGSPTFGVRDTGELNLWPTVQGGTVPVRKWTHVACTWDLVATRLFVDGIQVAATNLAPATGGRGASLGWRGGDASWQGLIDEVAIYDRALPSETIAAIHAAGASGRCKDSGSIAAPLITRQPASQSAVGDVTFSVTAIGQPPLAYQWFHDGRPLQGATEAELRLAFASIARADAGEYHVVVTNTRGRAESTVALLTVPPDLTVASVTAPASALAGTDARVDWTIANRGAGETAGTWRVRVALASDAAGTDAVTLRTVSFSEVVEPGAGLSGGVSVTLPADQRGERWIVVRVDPDNRVEEPDETNNGRAAAIVVAFQDRPDLAVANVAAPTSARPGQPVSFTWTVTNGGLAPASAPWSESLLVSNSAGGLRGLAVFAITNPLPPGTLIVRTQTVSLAADGPAGELTFWVETDSRREVTEESETNNRQAASHVTVVPRMLTLLLPFTEIAEDAPAPRPRGVVTRNGERTESLTVTLLSGDTRELAVPPSVIIPAGQATAEFTLEPRPDGVVDGAREVGIEASAAGFESAVQFVQVLDAERPRLTVTFADAGVGEGASLAGTVARDVAVDGAMEVSLASSDPIRLGVPAIVVLPADARTVAFTAEAPDDRVVESVARVTVTASASGAVSGTAVVEVRDDDVPRVVLELANRNVSESGGPAATTGTVTRDPGSPYPLTLELSSSDPAVVRVPAIVEIPARRESLTFPVSVVDDAVANGTREVRVGGHIRAAEGEARVGEIVPDRLEVTDDDGPALRLEILPGLVREGLAAAATLAVERTSSPVGALTVRLTSSDTTEAAVPQTVELPAGTNRVEVPVASVADGIADGSQAVVLTAAAEGHTGATVVLGVTDLDLPDLVVQRVGTPEAAETDSYVEVSYRLGNEGFAPTPTNTLTRVYLSSDAVFGDDTLVAWHRFPGVLAPGRYFEQSLPVRIPSGAGEYWVFVETDGDGVVAEGWESNNVRPSAAPIRVAAAYGAWVAVAEERLLAGSPVALTGRATNSLGAPAPFQLVHLHVRVRRTERVLAALTDAAGAFASVFQPLPGEAGAYEVFATHPGVREVPVQDTFALLGLVAEPASVSVRVLEGATLEGTLALVNPGDVPLTGVTAAWEGLPEGITGSVGLASDTVAGAGRGELTYTLAASATAVDGVGQLRVTTAEGVVREVPVEVAVERRRPRWVAEPAELVAGMLRGGQTLLEVTVANRGGAASEPAAVSLPPASWLSLATDEELPALAPGETHRLTLRLAPPADLELGDYAGSVAIGAGATALNIPFQFRCLSDAKGDLRVEVEDEFTYFAEGSPRVAGARVIVREGLGEAVVGEGTTGADGRFEARGLPEGYYRIEVAATDHDGFEVTRLLLAGRTNALAAFLRRQTVRYRWTVVPTGVEDRTRIVLETVFEASVPAPVITVEPASIDLGEMAGDLMQVDLKITNHGLIGADDVRLTFPTDPLWRFTPLVSELGTVPARSSFTIPLLIERVRGGTRPALASFGEPAVGDCVVAGTACGQYWCGQWIKFCQPIVLQRLRGDCGSSGTMSFPELKFRGDWTPTQGGTVNAGGGGGRGWAAPPNHVISPSTCQECIKVFTSVLTECSPEQIANHEAGWYLVYNLACRGEAPPGFGMDDVMPAVFSQMQANCPPDDDEWRPPDAKCYTLALACPGWADGGSAPAVASAPDVGPKPDPLGPARPQLHRLDAEAAEAARTTRAGSTTEPGLVDRVPPALARQIPLARTLAERLDRLEAGVDVLRVIFGDEAWIAGAEGTNFLAWVTRFTASLAPDSDAGERVSDAEHQALLDLPLAAGPTWDHVDRLVARCNRTADYNAAGIFDLDQVPAGGSTDFIPRDRFRAAVLTASQAVADSRAEGFANLVDAANAGYTELMAQLTAPGGGGGVCAQVRLRLEQEAVITRDGFRATLEVENGAEAPLQDVSVEIAIRDATGRDATGLFGVRPPELDDLSAVDGTGTIGARRTGRADWILVPGMDAAPEVPVEYAVSGILRYRQDGLRVTVPLATTAITVHPGPRLHVQYFHQRDVFGDDPYTDVIEPAVPFNLAVRIANHGRGDARNVRIVSGQPQIVENEKGLLVDFRILATEVAGRGLVPSLTADFGTITNGQAAIGRWLLASTIQGLFTEYSATFEHVDGLGNPRLSLFEEVTLHEMIRLVRATGTFEDGAPDFLVNEIPDAGDLPDTLYLSDGRTHRVEVVETATIDAPPSASRRTVQLNAAMPPGWGYLRIPEPGAGRFALVRVVRSDGVEIAVGTNVWTTDRTFPGVGRRPIREHRLHLLDFAGPGAYTLEYAEEAESEDTRAPESAVAALPAESPAQFSVAWSGDDEGGGSGLAYFDVLVSVGGAPFVPWLERTTRRSAVYPGNPGSTYAFYSRATDRAGNRETAPPGPDATTRASLPNRPPSYPAPFELTVDEGRTVEALLVAADPDGASGAGTLTYRAGAGMPPGAVLDAATGRFRWGTGEATGPGVYEFPVIAWDGGLPSLGATGQVRIVVREVNAAPVLAAVPEAVIAEGMALVVTHRATDADLPANALRFSLGAGAPVGATIDAFDGVFRWTPNEFQGPSTNRIEIVVTDDADPPARDARVFVVRVRDTRPDFRVGLGGTNLFAGETASVPIRLESGLDLERLRFVLEVPPGFLEDFALHSLASEVASATLEPVAPGRSTLDFALRSALASPGERNLGWLRFTARPGGSSAALVGRIGELRAIRSGGGEEPRGKAGWSRIVVVGAEPVLTLDRNPGPELRLHGHPGRLYVVERRDGLGVDDAWRMREALRLDGPVALLPADTGSDPGAFLRAYEAPAGVLRLRERRGSVFGLEAWGIPGRRYQVETSTGSPAEGPWVPLFELTPSDATLRVFDWTNRNEPMRFFRLKEE